MVGKAFVANYIFSHLSSEGIVSYETMFGSPVNFGVSVPGELVFFKLAPTIISYRAAKVESNLIVCVFLDYYAGPDGKFTGQYIAVGLEDFAAKSLHKRVDRNHFTLRLHRTEVLRRPATSTSPVFPFHKKYMASNYTLKRG